MSIISSVKSYIATYTGLTAGRPLWVDYLGAEPTQYAIIPLAGARKVEEYLDGGAEYEYPFAFQSAESTADELERLETSGFFELFASWLERQSDLGVLPSLGNRRKTSEITVTGWGFLYQQGQSDTGIYQVQCKVIYQQSPYIDFATLRYPRPAFARSGRNLMQQNGFRP